MKKLKKIFITTPLFYPSDKPHLGHAYSVVIADILKRYYELINVDVILMGGLDAHGEKILLTAEKNKTTPEFLISKNKICFQNLWEKLNVKFDIFITTSDSENHKQYVKNVFNKLEKKKIIYKGLWTGFYCSECEENYSQKSYLKNSKCKIGHSLIEKQEKSYFLKTNNYKDWIKKIYENNEIIVEPHHYINEINSSFLNEIQDLSLTRKNLSWGISIKNNNNYTVYVWFDALLAYLSSGLKYFWNFKKTKIIHIIGKEILRFHSIYWPIILKNLGYKLFNKILIHGWILFDNTKMSKSIGNVVDPSNLLKSFDRDILRFYLINLNISSDNTFQQNNISEIHNIFLSNLYGNLISRFFGLIKKNDFSISKTKVFFQKEIFNLNEEINNFIIDIQNLIFKEKITEIIEQIFKIIKKINQLIENLKPWELKINDYVFQELIIFLYKSISSITFLLSPILIDSKTQIFEKLLINEKLINLNFCLKIKNFCDKKLENLENNFFERIIINFE